MVVIMVVIMVVVVVVVVVYNIANNPSGRQDDGLLALMEIGIIAKHAQKSLTTTVTVCRELRTVQGTLVLGIKIQNPNYLLQS